MNQNTPAEHISPSVPGHETFMDAAKAVARLKEIYTTGTTFLAERFAETVQGNRPPAHFANALASCQDT